MRIKHLAAAFLIALIAVPASFAELRRPAADEIAPCELLVQNIERQLEGVERNLDVLAELARLGTEADRQKIAAAKERFSQMRDALQDQYGATVSQIDFSCEECVLSACRQVRPALVDISEKLVAANRELGRTIMDIRGRIATAKRVGHAIRVTDRALFRAAQLAKKTDNGVEAFPGLRRAFEIQEQAKQALAGGQFELAMKMTIRARDLIGRTIKDALDAEELEQVRDRAVAFWKQTNRMIKRIEASIDPSKNVKAARLLAMASKEQARARELADDYPYRALRHARAARRIVNELIRFYQRAKNCDQRAARLEQRLENAKEIVEESDNEKAAELLERAANHYEKGVELCQAGDAGKATAQFDIAAKLGAKAVDIAKGNSPRVQALKREIRKTALIVKRAGEIAETDRQKEAIEKAQRLVGKAKENVDNPKACLKLLDKATDIAFNVIAQAKRTERDSNED